PTYTPPSSTADAPELLFGPRIRRLRNERGLSARDRSRIEGGKRWGSMERRDGRRRPRAGARTQIRYGSQPGSTCPRRRRNPAEGANGCRCRWNPASCGVRSIFLALHRRHAATTFSHTCSPPRDRGSTWSRFSAAAPQYWQRHASRAKTARRVSGACARNGTWTKWRRRTTDGASIAIRSLWKIAPLLWTTSAFSFRTSTTARLAGTTASGNSVALSTRARPMAVSVRVAHVSPGAFAA